MLKTKITPTDNNLSTITIQCITLFDNHSTNTTTHFKGFAQTFALILF